MQYVLPTKTAFNIKFPRPPLPQADAHFEAGETAAQTVLLAAVLPVFLRYTKRVYFGIFEKKNRSNFLKIGTVFTIWKTRTMRLRRGLRYSQRNIGRFERFIKCAVGFTVGSINEFMGANKNA